MFSINSLNLESLFHIEGGFVLSFANPIKQDRKLMFPPPVWPRGVARLGLVESLDQPEFALAHTLHENRVVEAECADSAPKSERQWAEPGDLNESEGDHL